MPGDFARSADFSLPTERLKKAIRTAAGEDRAHFFDATQDRGRAVRQFARRQHVHARLRLPARRLPVSAEAVERRSS
jgi:indolepyruvate ferredoxin oxidoreductase